MGGRDIAAISTPLAGSRLRERLRGVSASALGSPRGGLRGFLTWWGQALLSWLPRRWRLVLGMDRGRLLLQPELPGTPTPEPGLQLRLHDADGLRDLARLPALGAAEAGLQAGVDTAGGASIRSGAGPGATAQLLALLTPTSHDLPRWLLLPASVALRRPMTLPAAAAERLRDVVAFEIDRQTPFSADAVAFDARVLARREGDAQVEVELVAVPRDVLAAAEAAIGDLAEHLAGIDVLGSDGAPLGVNLLDLARRRQQADPMRRWNGVLALVALLAAAAMLWQVLDNRRAAAAAFEQEANQRARQARSVSTQRAQLAALVDGQAFLDRTRAARPTAVEVLDDMTRRLPDGTYLNKFAIEGEAITLIGRSSEATALLRKLESSKLWRDPALAGALQQDPRSGRDIFTITADLASAPPQEARRGPGN